MIRRLGRCLQYRKGLAEGFSRNHWSNPSSSQTTAASVEHSTDQPRDSDFAANFKNLLPSQQFRSLLSDGKKKRLDHLIKQVELYCYMAKKVPKYLEDSSWEELLEIKSVAGRVSHLEFLAVKLRREENDRQKSREDNFHRYIEEQDALYKAGGMGYGPEMYELISNPLRRKQRLNLLDGSRFWSSLRLADLPTLVLDMQYIFDGKHRGEFKIKRQLQYVVTENLHASRPLPIHFANVAHDGPGRAYMEQSLGFWSNKYTEQMILPDYGPASPRESVIKATGKRNPKIVYISRYAKKVLDGPLTADAYVVCASYDLNRESIIAAHKDKIDAYRLPIHKYVKWQAGPQVIPFPNMARIFRELIDNGGNWKEALYNNIAKRHIDPPSEEVQAIRQSFKRNIESERADIIGAIVDSYGEEMM